MANEEEEKDNHIQILKFEPSSQAEGDALNSEVRIPAIPKA
jgi:hypothetical protein